MGESNKWFREKWNRLEDLQRIEKQSWEEFDNIMVDEIGNRFIKIEKLKKMEKLEKKKSRFYNEDILDRFDKSLKRDKSKDIIKGNFLKNNEKLYNSIMSDFLNSRIRNLFSDFIVKINSKDEKLFIEGLNKKNEIRKMF